jgi:hypothetical protein
MVEIIDFKSRKHSRENLKDRNVETRREYLLLCQNVLLQEDFFDVVCGILDPDYYDDLEESLKDIADVYFTKASP